MLKFEFITLDMKAYSYALAYYSLLGALALLISVIQVPLYDHIKIERVFATDVIGILLLIALVLVFVLIFGIQLKLYQKLVSITPDNKLRVKYVSLALLTISPLIYFIDLPIVPSIIALISYTLFFDLFIETKKLSLTWCIWWMIILGAFLSLLVFNRVINQQDKEIKEDLIKAYQLPSTVYSSKARTTKLKVDQLDLQQISTISYPSKIASFDIEAFYADEIKPIQQELKADYHHFYCFDNKGESLIEDSEYLLNEMKVKVGRGILIGDQVIYDPFTTSTYYKYELENDDHPGSPFQFYIEFSTNGDKFLFDDYQLYRDNKAYGTLLSGYPETFHTDETSYISGGKKFISSPYPQGFSSLSIHNVVDLIKPISLFSYIFVLLILSSLILLTANRIRQFLPKSFNTNFFTGSLQNKIQLTIIMLIVSSFILIGFITIYYFNQISNQYARVALERKLDLATKMFQKDNFNYNELQNTINDLHHSEEIDIYLINESSEIIASNYKALELDEKLHATDTLQTFSRFQIENMSYQSMTAQLAVVDDSPVYIKIIADSQSNSVSYVSDFIGTLINIYVFLFIIAGAIAIFISKPITDPISAIGERMRQLKLGKRNEPLDYNSEDELGALVKEYNLMISKLEDSTKMIAQSERDSAWREMAKQVAHEIKNPLTPMKLSIQYLQRAVGMADADPHELIKRISSTLIEQIDNLTQIANEFSNFGTLPKGNNEKVILNEVVEAIHDLFRKRDDMDIMLEEPIDDVIVFADKNHLIRILNNLLKNAMQAIPEQKRGRINLRLYTAKSRAIIKVSDNGTGIPPSMRDKVFTPNFTTKSSGTGLGLAISATMLETFNGKIYFETEENIGTDFYIEIPLMRSEEVIQDSHLKTENRVYLD